MATYRFKNNAVFIYIAASLILAKYVFLQYIGVLVTILTLGVAIRFVLKDKLILYNALLVSFTLVLIIYVSKSITSVHPIIASNVFIMISLNCHDE